MTFFIIGFITGVLATCFLIRKLNQISERQGFERFWF